MKQISDAIDGVTLPTSAGQEKIYLEALKSIEQLDMVR